jgi:hypothetical protein
MHTPYCSVCYFNPVRLQLYLEVGKRCAGSYHTAGQWAGLGRVRHHDRGGLQDRIARLSPRLRVYSTLFIPVAMAIFYGLDQSLEPQLCAFSGSYATR